MTFQIGQITRRLVDSIRRPERDGVKLIDGGPNAPELGARPVDYRPDATGIDFSEDWFAEVKVDGIRCLRIDGRLVTLQGQPFNAARHCAPALDELEEAFGQPMFFDGEYIEEHGFEATNTAYKKGEGQGTLWLFDAVPMDQWRDDRCTAPYVERKAALLACHRQIADRYPFVGALHAFALGDVGGPRKIFDRMRQHHHEGVVFKRGASTYSRSRTDDWQRMKQTDTTDFRLIDMMGTDKSGATRLVLKGPRGPITLTKGFASAKHVLWQNRDLYLGEGDDLAAVMVEVKHNGFTAHGQPRHAVFSKLRSDRQPPEA